MQRDKRGRFVKKAQKGTSLINSNILTGNTPVFMQNLSLLEPEKIKYYIENGKYYDMSGLEIDGSEIMLNGNKYTFSFKPSDNLELLPNLKSISVDNVSNESTESSGMTIYDSDKLNKFKEGLLSINKGKLSNLLELVRAGIGTSVNNKIAERVLEAEKPFLLDISENHRPIYGDYRSLIEGEKASAKLRNLAANPMTSDGALLQQMMVEAQIKGQEYIDQGNARDEALIRQTREVARQQEKENLQQRQAVAMQNRQAMLMSEKNKLNILNARDSANYSLITQPLLASLESRLRLDEKEQEYYKDYYNNALIKLDVWNNFRDGVSATLKDLLNRYLTGGDSAVIDYIGTDKTKEDDWYALNRIMNNEIIKRLAANRGVYINPSVLSGTNLNFNNYGIFGFSLSAFHKQGGTIYKAKLTKRTKDSDRNAKSIESSKKIAARFIEKAIDSLYTYKDVELIAKAGKRKYLAGGGLPFVGFTPISATSERGETKSKETSKKDTDLTTKDILELLKDMDGLYSDIDVISKSLSNFVLSSNDPFSLDSSSSIASRYNKVISQIKKAKLNKEWYNKAYDHLRENGALNEYAIDSTGHFIGMNASGDFERFTAQQVAAGETKEYTILTNSNLLDIRNRYPQAAFNSNLIMEAANGISMGLINEYISKIIQNLGSDKSETLIFGNLSKEVLSGLRLLLDAAKQVGLDLTISDLYEARIFTETLAQQAKAALSYIYQTLPSNMKSLLFAKTGSMDGVENLITSFVVSKLSNTTKLEFSPKNKKGTTSSSAKGNITTDGLDLSPALMLQQGFGERELITILDSSSTGLQVLAITMPVTKDGNKPIGSATLEDVATSLYGGILNFTNASMGGQIIPFEGRRNIAVDGSKIYSMYLPIDLNAFFTRGDIIPDISLIDKVNAVNKTIKEKQITNPREINAIYEEAGLPVYLNDDGTVVPEFYRRFGVLNGTAIDNAFGKTFVESKYLKEVDDEDIINNAINIMNQGRDKEDRIEYDAKNFFNFGGLLGDYDTIYQGTIFIPMSNDVFLGIAGSGENITSTEANYLEAKLQQHERVSATYKNPGQLR